MASRNALLRLRTEFGLALWPRNTPRTPHIRRIADNRFRKRRRLRDRGAPAYSKRSSVSWISTNCFIGIRSC